MKEAVGNNLFHVYAGMNPSDFNSVFVLRDPEDASQLGSFNESTGTVSVTGAGVSMKMAVNVGLPKPEEVAFFMIDLSVAKDPEGGQVNSAPVPNQQPADKEPGFFASVWRSVARIRVPSFKIL